MGNMSTVKNNRTFAEMKTNRFRLLLLRLPVYLALARPFYVEFVCRQGPCSI